MLIRERYKSSMRVFSNVYALVFAAILVALSVTGKLFSFNIGLDIRLSYENLPIAMAGLMFGPFAGLAVGIGADLCGCLACGYAVNPIITLGAGMIGFVGGNIAIFFPKRFSIGSILLADISGHIVGSIIIKTVGLVVYYGAEKGIWVLMGQRLLTYTVVMVLECIILVFLLSNKFVEKEVQKILNHNTHPFRKYRKKAGNQMTYEEAIEYIHSVCWKGSRPGLERITELCHRLGDPQDSLKFVHVTGTNGKGSTCAMTDSILREAGYKTGLFTSPYVKLFNERMMVNGENVSNERLAEVTAMVKPHAEAMADSPTEFELITAIAFMLFKLEGCDIVVLEAGMGGRLDSTNVIKSSLVSVITGVALEHTEYLGDTLAKIAFEKAGIIKSGCPVVYGGRDHGLMNAPVNGEKTAYAVIKEKADELYSSLTVCDYNALKVKKADLNGALLDYNDRTDVKIPLLGLYQPENCVKALTVIDVLRSAGYSIPEEAVRKGLEKVVWRARFEKLSQDPFILYDGSHNPEGIELAVKTLTHYFGSTKLNLLTGVMKDKDYLFMADMLAPLANKVFCVTPDNPRSLPSVDLSKVYSDLGVRSSAYETVDEGVRAAIAESKETGVPLICLGSLYMYAEVSESVENALK